MSRVASRCLPSKARLARSTWCVHGIRHLLCGALLLALGACATPPPADDAAAAAQFELDNDPLEPTNRTFFAISGEINRFVLGPLGYAYRKSVPEPVRDGVHNGLANLLSPIDFANHLLQGKPCRAGDTLLRFVINSSFGLGGLIDLAKETGIPAQTTDFGLTLATWGVPGGPYLYVPLLGPSNPRDLAGTGIDLAMDPLSWIISGRIIDTADWVRLGLYATDSAERFLDRARVINRTALDPYGTYRSLYRQHRANDMRQAREDDGGTVCGDDRRNAAGRS
jgi:phospholipid-binding lipoprotein MlaA